MSTKLSMFLPMSERLLDLSLFSMSKKLIDSYYSENSIEYNQFNFNETYRSLNKLMDVYESVSKDNGSTTFEERCFLFSRLYSIKGFSKAVNELGKMIGCEFKLKLLSDDEFHQIPYSEEDEQYESQVVVNVKLIKLSYENFISIKNYVLDAIKDLLWYVDSKCKLSVGELTLRLDFITPNNLNFDIKIITQNETLIQDPTS